MKLLLDLESFVLACPMCMSGTNSDQFLAANTAITVLFSILCLVLAAFVTFIVVLAKKAKDAPLITGTEV